MRTPRDSARSAPAPLSEDFLNFRAAGLHRCFRAAAYGVTSPQHFGDTHTVNRSIYATALASFIVLTAQAAFADTSSDAKQIVAPAATAAVTPSTQSVSMPAPAKVRPAARIPGTFDAKTWAQDTVDQFHVLMPGALSGQR